jgi:hypothetical protein
LATAGVGETVHAAPLAALAQAGLVEVVGAGCCTVEALSNGLWAVDQPAVLGRVAAALQHAQLLPGGCFAATVYGRRHLFRVAALHAVGDSDGDIDGAAVAEELEGGGDVAMGGGGGEEEGCGRSGSSGGRSRQSKRRSSEPPPTVYTVASTTAITLRPLPEQPKPQLLASLVGTAATLARSQSGAGPGRAEVAVGGLEMELASLRELMQFALHRPGVMEAAGLRPPACHCGLAIPHHHSRAV